MGIWIWHHGHSSRSWTKIPCAHLDLYYSKLPPDAHQQEAFYFRPPKWQTAERYALTELRYRQSNSVPWITSALSLILVLEASSRGCKLWVIQLSDFVRPLSTWCHGVCSEFFSHSFQAGVVHSGWWLVKNVHICSGIGVGWLLTCGTSS